MSDKDGQNTKTSSSDTQWLPKVNLILTMVLAAMGLWLNFNTQQQRQTLDAIGLEVAASRNEREERNAREQLRLQLFDKVSLSLRDGNPEHIAAARTLVESLLSTMEPSESELRVGLLRSLAMRAPEVQREALKQALDQEDAFRQYHEELREKAVLWSKEAEGNLDKLAVYRIDVFYCSGPATDTFKAKAEALAARTQGQVKAVKVRELAPSINASPGYGVIQTEIRFEASSEAAAARQLQQLMSDDPAKPLTLRQVRTATPLYLSVFVCG
jgi:hypothetical protein